MDFPTENRHKRREGLLQNIANKSQTQENAEKKRIKEREVENEILKKRRHTLQNPCRKVAGSNHAHS